MKGSQLCGCGSLLRVLLCKELTANLERFAAIEQVKDISFRKYDKAGRPSHPPSEPSWIGIKKVVGVETNIDAKTLKEVARMPIEHQPG